MFQFEGQDEGVNRELNLKLTVKGRAEPQLEGQELS
jgi:hypothetical protein